MRAMVIERFGGAKELTLVELPTPIPSGTQILVEIAYTSVNPVDWKIREGYLKNLIPHKFPLILGWDAAGTIHSVGKNVNGFKPGDRVFAYCRKPDVQWGTYAEFIALESTAAAKMPKNLSFAQAAAVPLVGLTAWQALFDFAGLKRGEKLLVHAGAGGVGGMAIQFASLTGALVTTTASRSNHSYVKELGASHVIDYSKENLSLAAKKICPTGYDVVLDCVGGETLRASYELVSVGGRLVSIVDQPDTRAAEARRLKAGFIFVAPNGNQLSRIAELMEEGKVLPLHTTEKKLEEAPQALDDNQARHVKGKIVLRIK